MSSRAAWVDTSARATRAAHNRRLRIVRPRAHKRASECQPARAAEPTPTRANLVGAASCDGGQTVTMNCITRIPAASVGATIRGNLAPPPMAGSGRGRRPPHVTETTRARGSEFMPDLDVSANPLTGGSRARYGAMGASRRARQSHSDRQQLDCRIEHAFPYSTARSLAENTQ